MWDGAFAGIAAAEGPWGRGVVVVGHKVFVMFERRALGQNKQNHPWFCIEKPWRLADPLLREAVVIQGPWGFWQ